MNATYAKVADNDVSKTENTETEATDEKTSDFFDAMLSEGEVIDDLVCQESGLAETIQKLLALAAVGLVVYGFALGAILQLADASHQIVWTATGTPMLWMPPTMAGGFLAAIAICLPSFYFYTQLSGLDASFRLITAQSLRVQARTSVILLGVLPFWLAWALTPFLGIDLSLFDPDVVIGAGFLLPFIVGFAGLKSVYSSFRRLVERLPITHRRRGNFVLRLVACWAAVMVCVTPVAIFRIGSILSDVI